MPYHKTYKLCIRYFPLVPVWTFGPPNSISVIQKLVHHFFKNCLPLSMPYHSSCLLYLRSPPPAKYQNADLITCSRHKWSAFLVDLCPDTHRALSEPSLKLLKRFGISACLTVFLGRKIQQICLKLYLKEIDLGAWRVVADCTQDGLDRRTEA